MTSTIEATPAELLGLARGLLEADVTVATGVWPRAGALLARQALELALEQLWEAWDLKMEWVSARAQLLCFQVYVKDERLAEDVSHAWWALSRATHHQPFELAPTQSELLRWFDVVGELVSRIPSSEQVSAGEESDD